MMRGAVAGAVETIGRDVATDADRALRGRESSGRLATRVGALADRAGSASLGSGATDEGTNNRRRGVGALLGDATAAGVGMGDGAVGAGVGGHGVLAAYDSRAGKSSDP